MKQIHPKRALRVCRQYVHYFFNNYLPSLIPDKWYLKWYYKKVFGRELDLDNPKTLNEKIQWLKLHDRNPLYHQLIDKYEAKKIIASKIGEEYVIPTLGIYDRFEDIDFDKLPDQFVIKCTHDAGSTIICKDKSKFNIDEAREKLKFAQRIDYYRVEGRQWGYKGIKPRIIVEPYLEDESGYELKDYKIFCFNGKPEYVEVDFNRWIKHKLNPYDFDWNPLHFCDTSKNDYAANIPKPARLEDMRRIARILSNDIPFVRVDFYSIYDKIYVGEMTFYPGGGYIQFDPQETDLYYGQKLDLSKVQKRK